MDVRDKQLLDAAIDRAMEGVLEDDLPAFGGEKQLRGLMFGQLNRIRRNWRRPSTCIFPECNNLSVRSSHTIQESALRLIAENGNLLKPSLDLRTGRPFMDKVGVGQAATFPGFCEQHEGVFASFEQHGTIRSDHDAQLQLFRTVCRELVFKRFEIEHIDSVITALSNLLHDHLLKKILSNLDAELQADISDLKICATNRISSRVEYFKRIRRQLAAVVTFIETELYPQAAVALQRQVSGLPWVRLTLQVDGTMGNKTLGPMLPVALAGMASFHIEQNGVPEEVQLVVHAIPGTSGTDIMFAAQTKHEACFDFLLQRNPPTAKRMLELIEGWMIYGTDNWFISPSAWDSLSLPLQERILHECSESRGHNCFKLDFNVFDTASASPR